MDTERLTNPIRDIVERVRVRLAEAKGAVSLEEMQKRARLARPIRNFEQAISEDFCLIAEVKRKSPSLGMMEQMKRHDVLDAAKAYEESPCVRAISVLTNRDDFGMGIEHLQKVGEVTSKPLLRKDFIFDPYQVWEARAHGADAILLMANVLQPEALRDLANLAESLGMSVLFESHTETEIKKIPATAKIWGINSRAFMSKAGPLRYWASRVGRLLFGLKKDLSIKREHFELAAKLPSRAIKVAESGVSPKMVGHLKNALGYHSILVGTSLLNSEQPVRQKLAEFEKAIKAEKSSASFSESHSVTHQAARA